jgi:Xaa-Pro aminopeptidase
VSARRAASATPANPGAAEQRLELLLAAMADREIDALLVSSMLNLRYLTGFSGSSGLALIVGGGGALGSHRFITDFRYALQSAEQVPAAFAREIVLDKPLEAAAAALDAGEGRLGFDDASLTVAEHERLRERLGERWQLVSSAGMVERLRAVKDAGELELMRAASELADEALLTVLEDGVVGRSERDVAIDVELRMRRLGAEAPSFPAIVAAGAHGALPHAEPRAARIPPDVLVTIDWGARFGGYCSDCTRTYATGEEISARAREVYELTRSAQQQALDAARAGLTGPALDAVARAVIEQAGEGEHFGHGLGHGVGLDVHEGPRVSRTAGEEPLRAGNVVTIEPGIYLPHELGVRIEDLVLLTDGGHEVLTGLPKELTVVA